jgi:hypothetical protein
MTFAKIPVLLTEQVRLSDENAALCGQVAQLMDQLQMALAGIAELEQRKPEPPAFVKPNRPSTEPKGPRKKRAPEHNTSRKRAQPTRIERHVLERCLDCNYHLSGGSIADTREVIEHQVVKCWCPHCTTWHSPKLDLAG